MFQPIAVGRIGHWDTFSAGQCCELPIAGIKSGIDQRLRQIGILTIISSRQFDPLDSLRFAPKNLQIEPVTYSRLATGIQMPPVLTLDLAGQVDQDAPGLEHSL